jgi:pimeloyl-ACP methyl ester carboxylesterase
MQNAIAISFFFSFFFVVTENTALLNASGAGCSERHACFFDPQHYRIVFFYQRGCGKSSPRGSLEKNTTWDLVADIKKLRLQLGVTRSSLLFFFSSLCSAQPGGSMPKKTI